MIAVFVVLKVKKKNYSRFIYATALFFLSLNTIYFLALHFHYIFSFIACECVNDVDEGAFTSSSLPADLCIPDSETSCPLWWTPPLFPSISLSEMMLSIPNLDGGNPVSSIGNYIFFSFFFTNICIFIVCLLLNKLLHIYVIILFSIICNHISIYFPYYSFIYQHLCFFYFF